MTQTWRTTCPVCNGFVTLPLDVKPLQLPVVVEVKDERGSIVKRYGLMCSCQAKSRGRKK